MLELLIFIGALSGIGSRAQQRGLNRTNQVAAAGIGWAFFFILSVTILGPVGILFRWGWIGCVYLFIEMSHRGAKVSNDSWQCPDCRLFNDGRTLVCLCGYKHPEAPADIETLTSAIEPAPPTDS